MGSLVRIAGHRQEGLTTQPALCDCQNRNNSNVVQHLYG
jgi:hypothetical protein